MPERTAEERLELRLDHYRQKIGDAMYRNNIPDYMRAGLMSWVIDGREQGGFLMALVSNDFMDICRRADDNNQRCLWSYGSVFYSVFPVDSFGSPEAVKVWSKTGGLRGAIRDAEPPIRPIVDDETVDANGKPVDREETD